MPENAFDRFIDAATTTTLSKQRLKGGSGAAALKYPLKDDDKYLGRLSFQVVNENEHRVDLGADFTNVFSGAANFASGFFSTIFDTVASGAFKGSDKASIRPSVTDRSFNAADDFPKISLYLPQAINIQDAVAYDNNMQLGRIGAGVEGAVSAGGDAASTMSEMGSGAAESIAAMAAAITGGKVSPEVASSITQGLAKRYGTEGAAAAFSLATQTALNPNTRTLFQSVPIRQFSFSFTLIASSADESRVIEEIIRNFRTELYPEKIIAAGIDYAYRFPRRFLIKATYNDKEWPGIKFLPCYLQNFQAVYNPNSMGFHKDGQWSEVQITMSFSESRALAKQDIENHYQGL